MRELSLFTGIGGGLLASKLLGWQTVCAVEIEPYCRKVLQARQSDGMLESFTIYEDVRTFSGAEWQGKVDLISAGFPCQFISSAARGRNTAPNLWPEVYRIVQECKPRIVFAENVKSEPIENACEDLYKLGYSTRWTSLCPAYLGAPITRERYWLVADSNPDRELRCPEYAEAPCTSAPQALEWWKDDSRALGVSAGLSNRLDRMRGLGNAQSPIVAALAFKFLFGLLR